MSLRHVILTVLSERDATGYEIAKAFDESLAFFWNASHQQLYRDLKALEREGLVTATLFEQAHRPDKKVYCITAAGRQQQAVWLSEPVETRVNSVLLVKLWGMADASPARALALLGEQRTLHEAKLRRYDELMVQHFGDMAISRLPYPLLIRYLALRRGIRGEQDWIAWIDECVVLIGSAESPVGKKLQPERPRKANL